MTLRQREALPQAAPTVMPKVVGIPPTAPICTTNPLQKDLAHSPDAAFASFTDRPARKPTGSSLIHSAAHVVRQHV